METCIASYYRNIFKINGKLKESLIEVKPYKQTIPPKMSAKPNKKYLTEVKAYGINEAKWIAAQSYCKDRGWDFKIMTEKELGIK